MSTAIAPTARICVAGSERRSVEADADDTLVAPFEPGPVAGLSLESPGSMRRMTAEIADPLGGSAIPGEVAGALRRLQGNGEPLPTDIADRAGQSLGHDLSDVRVHADAEANRLARYVQSIAFTHGNDIYFSSGSYQPTSPGGQQVIAHELAHVAQSGSGGESGTIGRADDPAEAAADRAAAPVTAALRRSDSVTSLSDGRSNLDGGGHPAVPVRRRTTLIRRLLDADTMKALYDGQADDLVISNPALNNIFENEAAAVKAVVGIPAKTVAIRDLRLFLDNKGSNEVAARWTYLKKINAALGTNIPKLRANDPNVYLTTVQLADLEAKIAAAPDAKALLKPYAEAGKGLELLRVLAPKANVGDTEVQDIAAYVSASGGVVGNKALEQVKVRNQLTEVMNVHPADAARPKLAWGTGNSKTENVADNIREHALKHLLRLNDSKNKDPNEPFKWMTLLGYQVHRDFIQGILGFEPPEVDSEKMYDKATGYVVTQDQANHFFNVFLPKNQTVIDTLMAKFAGAYEAHVRDAAVTMKDVFVTADGFKVYLVGQDGPVFIACRWEGPATGFTISSGYFSDTQHTDNKNFKAWALK